MNIETLQEVFSNLSFETKKRVFREYVNNKYLTDPHYNYNWLNSRVNDILEDKYLFLQNIFDPNYFKSKEERIFLEIIKDWESYSGLKVKNYYNK